MSSPMPDFADPWRLCTQGKAFRGSLALADLPRLRPLLAGPEGEVRFDLAFGRDAQQRAVVSIRVNAVLRLCCQRCMGVVEWPVESASRLALVAGPEEAARLPEGLDPLLVEEPRLALATLVEDELILAVPVAPLHAVDDCAVDLAKVNAPSGSPAEPAPARENPFAVLAGLHGDDDKLN
jgi:uncharacterized protein